MLIQANALQIPLADRSVHCVVTSPPYWGLRKYEGAQEILWTGAAPDMIDPTPCVHEWEKEMQSIGRNDGGNDIGGRGGNYKGEGPHKSETATNSCLHCGAWRGQLGLEPTIEMYVSHMVQIFREVRRVLRDDGTLWLNLGDSYAAGGGGGGRGDSGNNGKFGGPVLDRVPKREHTLKPKDLCGIPWRVAFALQADGWYLRSDIIWAKPNPMPESVTDRPTKAHEYIFLLTKSQRYFYDADAVKEPSVYPDDDRKARADESQKRMPTDEIAGVRPGSATYPMRNLRTVWEITTQPYAGAHFATFPEEIPRRCIAAGTSEHGVCSICGAPWERVTKVHDPEGRLGKGYHDHENDLGIGQRGVFPSQGAPWKETTGWRPTCSCETTNRTSAIVFDPFGGSGTVGEVALKMGRRFILLDLAYQHLQLERIGLFANT